MRGQARQLFELKVEGWQVEGSAWWFVMVALAQAFQP
jgi:hypothetical protein